MAIWRPLPAAALAAVVLATAATPAAAAATVPTTTTMTAAASKVMAATTTAATTAAAILTPSGRQCTQAGDFPHHDGCSATVRGVSVPLPALRGRWYMWDLSNNAKDYYKTLLGIGFRREVTCPTMDNTVSKGVVSTKLCMRSRARPGGRITTTCARFRIRRAAGRRGRYDPAAPLVWRWAAGPRRGRRRRVGARVTILAAVRFPRGGRLKSFATYACPAGHAPPRLPCVQNGPPEVVGVWTRVLRRPGLFASAVMSRRRLGFEALNEFQLLDCPTFRT